MSNKKLIIVMPMYNAEATVAKAIESLLSQTFTNFTLIIVDDCSTDNSLEIVKQYLSDSRIILYSNKENMGAYYSRNFGLYAMRNQKWDYFTTHDADDISFSFRYQALIRILEKSKNINAIQDTFERVDMFSGKVLTKKMTMAHAIFKREVFDGIGYFDNVRFGGDWEHWFRLTNYNKIVGRTTDVYLETMGESFIGNHNLTVIIPENSIHRQEYIKNTKIKYRKATAKSLYVKFEKVSGTRRVHNE